MTMLERVARAMMLRRADLSYQPLSLIYEDLARTAIAEMQSPTEQMIDAGVVADTGKTLGERVTNCFAAMIDAALSEGG